MSAVEEITGEMRRLVLRTKTLESKLADSVPKKTYNDAVAKMQLAIDSTQAELQRTKKELESTETLGGRLNALTGQVTAMAETISSQAAQVKLLEAKLSEGTVSTEIYNLSLAKATQLENDIKEMIRKEEFESLLQKNTDLQQQIATMVPKEDYDKAATKISELEGVLPNYVPRKELDDLTDEIISITNSVRTSSEEFSGAITESDANATTLDAVISDNASTVTEDSGATPPIEISTSEVLTPVSEDH